MEAVVAKFSVASRNVPVSGPHLEPLLARLDKITNDQSVTFGPVDLQAKTTAITPRLWVRI
jgi:hypothetical protein